MASVRYGTISHFCLVTPDMGSCVIWNNITLLSSPTWYGILCDMEQYHTSVYPTWWHLPHLMASVWYGTISHFCLVPPDMGSCVIWNNIILLSSPTWWASVWYGTIPHFCLPYLMASVWYGTISHFCLPHLMSIRVIWYNTTLLSTLPDGFCEIWNNITLLSTLPDEHPCDMVQYHTSVYPTWWHLCDMEQYHTSVYPTWWASVWYGTISHFCLPHLMSICVIWNNITLLSTPPGGICVIWNNITLLSTPPDEHPCDMEQYHTSVYPTWWASVWYGTISHL